MPDEADNLVLTILQRLQGDMSDLKQTLALHTKRFDKLDHRMGEMYESMYQALGLAAHANIRHESVGGRLDKLEDRVKKLEDEGV